MNSQLKTLLKGLNTAESKIKVINNLDDTEAIFNEIYNSLYVWQKEFIAASSYYVECCLIAANRIGKTYLGTFIDAVHLTGIYPIKWDGYKFSHAPLIWCLGYSGEKTRDLLQVPLFGDRLAKSFTGGLIPASRVLSHEAMAGTANAIRSAKITHKLGVSKLQFWSYSQGQHALMGDSVDFFHIDEEPVDQKIYPQVLTRTATGGNIIKDNVKEGGRGILTFTPENGRTTTVIKFMDEAGKKQFFMQKGWNDAPHLSDEVKETLLESFPVHQREMRTKGVPMLGHGRIYDFSEKLITCNAFDIPDHWLLIGGMDFGWDHPQAQVKLAINPDNNDIFLINAWKAENVSANDAWGACSLWQAKIPIAWPLDGLMHEKGRDDVKQQKDHYKQAGFNLLANHATFDGKSNSVEQGIYEIRQKMCNGTFKVFAGLRVFFDEFQQYHRDANGKIVKKRDDILDALRYAYMMRRFAKNKGDINKKETKPKSASRVNYL